MGVAQRFETANAKLATKASELGFSDPIPFLCECEDPGCFALVRLLAGEYAEQRAIGEPITIAEHTRTQPIGVDRRDGSGRLGEHKRGP